MIKHKYYCKHCNKQFISFHKRNGHQTYCKKNPHRQQTLQNLRAGILKRPPNPCTAKYSWYIFHCKKCGTQYSLYLSQRAYTQSDYTKYCTISCRQSRVYTPQKRALYSLAGRLSYKVKQWGARHALLMRKPILFKVCKQCGRAYPTKNPYQQYCDIGCVQKVQFRIDQAHELQRKIAQNRNPRVSYSGWGRSGW